MSGLVAAACRRGGVGDLLPDLTSDAQAEAALASGWYTVHRGGVEFRRSWALDLAAARSLCISCPALRDCRDLVREVPVSGVAAGLTEEEREDAGWIPPDDGPARAELALGEGWWRDLLGRAPEQWAEREQTGGSGRARQPYPSGLLDAVRAMREAGMTYQRIADLLTPDFGHLDKQFVEYLQRVATGKRASQPAVAS